MERMNTVTFKWDARYFDALALSSHWNQCLLMFPIFMLQYKIQYDNFTIFEQINIHPQSLIAFHRDSHNTVALSLSKDLTFHHWLEIHYLIQFISVSNIIVLHSNPHNTTKCVIMKRSFQRVMIITKYTLWIDFFFIIVKRKWNHHHHEEKSEIYIRCHNSHNFLLTVFASSLLLFLWHNPLKLMEHELWLRQHCFALSLSLFRFDVLV